MPQGFNCFRAPIIDASLTIKELNTRLKPIRAEFFIDYEVSDVTHLYKFDTPALHFALRAPSWLTEQKRVDQSSWTIHVDVKCVKAILNCIRGIRESRVK